MTNSDENYGLWKPQEKRFDVLLETSRRFKSNNRKKNFFF